MRKAVVVIELVAARVITEARMGPTQGVQTIPRLSPTMKPPLRPVRGRMGAAERRETSRSQ